MNPKAEFDVVVYGATGYTGRLVAEYMARRYGAGGEVRWAMAGRSSEKLAAVRDEIGAPDGTPFVLADAADPGSLRVMAERTKAVLTTVGPYQLYGSDLVAACAETGCDYLDLCGEPNWMRAMIDAHHAQAQESGARICFSCGFDSIPFELGVFFAQAEAMKRTGKPSPRVRGRVRGMQGGFSGGTFASMQATMAAAAKDPAVIQVLTDPFGLVPGFKGPEQPRGDAPIHEPDLGWAGPFVMATINSKNVHRSNALQGHAYGTGFVYDEMVLAPSEDAAKAAGAGLGGGGGGAPPKPGEGPTKAEREAGYFDVLFVAELEGGGQARVSVKGDMDPGYGSTSKMIAESAVCLVQDRPDTPGGVWTPGAAMGEALIARLQANAGFTFAVEA